MRRMSRAVRHLVLFVVVGLAPSTVFAQEHASVEAFGGLSLNSLQLPSPAPSLGGTVTFSLVPRVQIVGEAGRLGNVLPALSSAAFGVARTGIRASAWYGEAGARVVLAPSAVVTPYAEASAGIARLDVRSDRLGPVANAAASLALGLVGRTAPTFGAGGGMLLRGGPIVFDVGYRYKQLFPNDVMRIALGFGQPLRTHQVRVGVGVRF